MLRAAAGCLVLAACASAPPAEPLPATPISSMPAPASPDAAPQACLPALPSPTVDLLDGDARTIHVCFAPDACFAIDRRTSATATWTASAKFAPLARPRTAMPITVERAKERQGVEVCAGTECVTVMDALRQKIGAPAYGVRDDSHTRMLATYAGTDASRFAIIDERKWTDVTHIASANIDHCTSATWVGPDALVTDDDCEHPPGGTLYRTDGKLVARVGGTRTLDTTGAFAVHGVDTWAIVAPRAYSIVLLDLPDALSQEVFDLVPIQAESTPDPMFAVVSLPNGDWVVASPTGGVGVIDRVSHTMARTWIIPRCEAAP